MSRVIAFVACGFTLAACSSSLPSMDFFRSSPTTETLRIESEPPGADAKTAQGQGCRTPCEIAVPAGREQTVTIALNGYQPHTVTVKPDVPDHPRDTEPVRLTPNPIYVELHPVSGPKKKPAKKKVNTAANTAPAAAPAPAPAGTTAFPPPPMPNEPAAPSPAAFPWPTR